MSQQNFQNLKDCQSEPQSIQESQEKHITNLPHSELTINTAIDLQSDQNLDLIRQQRIANMTRQSHYQEQTQKVNDDYEDQLLLYRQKYKNPQQKAYTDKQTIGMNQQMDLNLNETFDNQFQNDYKLCIIYTIITIICTGAGVALTIKTI